MTGAGALSWVAFYASIPFSLASINEDRGDKNAVAKDVVNLGVGAAGLASGPVGWVATMWSVAEASGAVNHNPLPQSIPGSPKSMMTKPRADASYYSIKYPMMAVELSVVPAINPVLLMQR
jgi:hypothetical protein